jgi:hypothetical protein
VSAFHDALVGIAVKALGRLVAEFELVQQWPMRVQLANVRLTSR